MVIADENIDHSLIEAIRAAGIEVLSIYETSRGIRDEQIIESSRNPPRIILTEDKDFGEWVFAHGIQDISVIFLRYSFAETALLQGILLALLREKSDELTGCFTTVTVKKIRSRCLLY
jgi:predicted nuclease of predicted toxin-antitoxin system